MPFIPPRRLSSKHAWLAHSDAPTQWRSSTVFVVPLALLALVFLVIERLTMFHDHFENYQNINPQPVVHPDYLTPIPPDRRAVVSSLYSDSYAISVAVLGHSVRRSNVSARLILPYLEDRISPHALCIARTAGWEPLPVARTPPPHAPPHDHFTKLSVWSLDSVGIDAAVYLDADTLVRRPFDELFDAPWAFAAVPDAHRGRTGFTVTFNAGVLVLRTSSPVFHALRAHAETARFPPHEAEQAFLNAVFGASAARLPYAYNANIAIKHHAPALWAALRDEMRIVHYTVNKPFTDDIDDLQTIYTEEEQLRATERAAGRRGGRYREEVGWWRAAYEEMMRDIGRQVTACAKHYPRTMSI